MTITVDEHQQLKTWIRQYIEEESKVGKLVDYLFRHEVGLEVFAYLGFDRVDEYLFQPVTKEVYIRRIPFYFHKSTIEIGDLKTLGSYTFYSMKFRNESFESELENFYMALERLYYEFGITDTTQLFNYTINQTGTTGDIKPMYTWLHYLELAGELGIAEKTPRHLIVDYNYELHDQHIGDYIERIDNVLRVQGTIPCDKNNEPILRWIGVKIKNAKKVWVKVNDRLEGSLYIEISPLTKVWGLNVWGKAVDGSNIWYDLYTGPLLMEFDYGVIKDRRVAIGMTQKQVAEAIGASSRIYQKSEHIGYQGIK